MTVRFVAGQGGQNTAASVSVDLPNPVKASDLLIALVEQNLTGAASIPNFTASTPKAIGASSARATLLKLAAEAGQSSTIAAAGTGSPTSMHEHVAVFSGATATEDATMVSASSPGAATSLASGDITTTTPGCLLVAYLATQGNAGTVTPPSGFTLVPLSTQRAVLAWRVAPAAGVYGASWAWGASTSAAAGIAAFRPGAVPSAGLMFR